MFTVDSGGSSIQLHGKSKNDCGIVPIRVLDTEWNLDVLEMNRMTIIELIARWA